MICRRIYIILSAKEETTIKNYTDINAETWDRWAENGCEWTLPISHAEYENTTKENFIVYLTPCIAVPPDWLGELQGKKLLGLASGGGQQMPVFSKLGAKCTVFDYSFSQLEKEKMVAKREGYEIEIIRGDMTRPLPFEDETFDIIFHPVSNCYVEEIKPIWKECFRVLKKGGRLLSGFDNGLNFLVNENTLQLENKLPFNPLKMPRERMEAMIANQEGVQFSHSLEEEIGGQLRAGFTLKALYEDRDRTGSLKDYAPQYAATLSEK